MENELVCVKINANGTLDIFDKATGRQYEGLGWFRDSSEVGDPWFHKTVESDTLYTTLNERATITLVRDDEGVYEYLDNTFHPIDGSLLGNEGDDHNNFFTYAIRAEFTYEQCTGQFVEFMGTDDAWLFIDGNMVMEILGLSPGPKIGQILNTLMQRVLDNPEYNTKTELTAMVKEMAGT